MTRADLISEIRALSELMLDVATAIDYFGGFDAELNKCASELAIASAIADTWADGMEAEQ